MSVQFHTLKVRDLRRETPDAVSISFALPADIRSAFRFVQGQYLTLKTVINGEELRRSYSICTGVDENDLRVAVKKVDGGLFSTWANEQLKVGDTLEVMTPQGNFFTELKPENHKIYVAFAAGSGITPVMSILRTTLVQEPGSRFILFYGNRSFDYIIFREQLEELKNLYPDRLSVHHILSRESLGSDLFQGRITGEKCARYAKVFFNPAEVDAFFLCGPEEMVFEVKETLSQVGANPKSVHFELFNTTAGKAKPVAASNKEVFEASITVIQDGSEFDFKLPSDGSTLLDAAMRAGADLPFSCKGGVCSTCKAKILEGKAEMRVNYGLEPDEVEAGYVLTCQAHPISKRVVVSFDA
ncbi:MAG: phenylacetate-CoA oxygenase/reductase subunit PaaK [Saprospiraceae bacterium]|nr:phenylacetate-CoA oxygenase/reductase subunit PaaK [Saprospiraceae bacterium]